MIARGRRLDAALVAAFAILGVVERSVSPEADGPWLSNAVAAIAVAVPFWWWRTAPPAAAVAFAVLACLSGLAGTPADSLLVTILELIGLGFAAGRYAEGRERTAILAVLVVLSFVLAVLGAGLDTVAFPLVVLSGGAVVGALLRSRIALTRELAERTHELEAERDARAQAAVLSERRRIARELHDVIAHTVSIMVVQAGGARRQLGRDTDRALAALDQVEATGEDALRELGRLFGLLHGHEGVAALPRLVERTRDAGLPVTLEVSGTPAALASGSDLAAYRVVQEALTNTLKHAGPATATVQVRWEDTALAIVVRDTGWGAEGPRGDGSRRGLEGMRDRVAQYGGDVDAGPVAGGGFEVRARLPLAREEVHA